MTVLYLGPVRPSFERLLASRGSLVLRHEDKPDLELFMKQRPELVISYGYRYMVRQNVLERFPDRVFNLHVSALPWNRGADPNLWSFLDDTPKGVTIHKMDVGLDTGEIVAQKIVDFGDLAQHTLSTTYSILSEEIELLFQEVWPSILSGSISSFPQKGTGTVHKLRDKEIYAHLMKESWNTPVKELVGANQKRLNATHN